MPSVTATNTAQEAQASKAKLPKQEMDKNAFLMLLVAQLQNQDPTSNQDPAQMVQQMTAFSTVEQLQNMGELLKGIQAQNAGVFQAQATSLVGKRVRVQSSALDLQGGKSTIGIELPQAADVTLMVKDAQGKVVASIPKGGMTAGQHQITWDGKSADGVQLPDGTYSLEVTAKDVEGKPVKALPTTDLKVDSVAFVDGTVFLVAGGRRFSLNDVVEVKA